MQDDYVNMYYCIRILTTLLYYVFVYLLILIVFRCEKYIIYVSEHFLYPSVLLFPV